MIDLDAIAGLRVYGMSGDSDASLDFVAVSVAERDALVAVVKAAQEYSHAIGNKWIIDRDRLLREDLRAALDVFKSKELSAVAPNPASAEKRPEARVAELEEALRHTLTEIDDFVECDCCPEDGAVCLLHRVESARAVLLTEWAADAALDEEGR